MLWLLNDRVEFGQELSDYNEWLMETHNSMKKAGLISDNEDDEEA